MTTEEIIKAIRENKAYKIYKDKNYKKLRARVLKDLHNECQRCKANGKVTRAVLVHHVREVKKYPELAYKEFFIDEDGNEKRNLLPLCKQCHEEVHGRYGYRPNQIKKNQKKEPVTPERW